MTWSRSSWYWKLGLASALAVGGAVLTFGNCALAQIKPDATLGAESSRVTSSDRVNFRIDGGATRGTNLFHSFSEFSVPTKGLAFFDNASGIQNIISRVTGGSISNIDGLIQANDSANLFLLNPNGVIFGPNASLNIGGSFVASTANSLNFADGSQFSATAPQTPPLLIVSVPIGLQFGSNPASIVNQSQAPDSISGELVGLQVDPGKTLALVGGDVSLEGGVLSAPGGRVELGGVTEPGTVGLNGSGNNLSLSFPDQVARADVSLTNGAFVGVTAGDGGSIAINARNLDISRGSTLVGGIGQNLGAPGAQAGDITLNATEAITITAGSNIFNTVGSGALGSGGNINIITTGTLRVNDAILRTDTFGQGKAGNVSVHASDSVSLNGNIRSIVNSGAMGDGGDISITTGSLWVNSRALLSSSTNGRGDAGNVTINARNQVSFQGGDVNSRVEGDARGNGGTISITTGSLSLTEGTELLASTLGRGNAGNITINAETASLEGVTVNSRVGENAKGNGGTISITTTGSLSVTNEISRRINTSTLGRGNAGNITINAETASLEGGTVSSRVVGENAKGNGGTISITTTGSLSVTNGARITTSTEGRRNNAGRVMIDAETVSLEGVGQDGNGNPRPSGIFSDVEGAEGRGGNIILDTTNLNLIDGARISAGTTSGNGGNITLRLQDLLLLRNESRISTNAGTEQAPGDGGNIIINTGNLVALGNSDIAADAFTGKGGTVRINAQGSIFGTEAREEQTPESDITANSQQGLPQLDGMVEINTPDVELQSSLTPPSANFISPEQVVVGSCLARRNVERGSFTVTGTGGLPRSPYEAISGQFTVAGVQPIQASNSAARGAEVVESAPWKRGDPIQEAQGMVVTADGRTLVGTTPQLVALAKAQSLVCHSD